VINHYSLINFHFSSGMSLTEDCMRKCLLLSIGLASLLSIAASQAAQQAQQLDYGFYKTRVEPIFLARRAGHARCYACHALGAGEGNAPAAMRLELLSPGTTIWSEDQTRKNFDAVSRKVVPGRIARISGVWPQVKAAADL
jgi:hypothetical protein